MPDYLVAMGALEISLLGGFQLRRDGEQLAPIPLRTARSLFAYLVLNRDRTHTRDLLVGTFWPDMPEPRARRRLSHALWQIQSTLGDDRYLITTADSVRFDPDSDFWLDVDEFEWTIEQATPEAPKDAAGEQELLRTAVDLYRGNLLAGFYDDWLFTDQDRLHQRFLGVLERLTDLAMARGDYDTALIHARRLVQHDPLRESAHRRVMQISVLVGRHNEAIRQFEYCSRLLADELGTEPSPQTVRLYEEILADRQAGAPRLSRSTESPLFGREEAAPFIGREQERSALVQGLDGVMDGRGSVVLVEGESGVGKTRLLDKVVEDARWRGMSVLWGRTPPSGGRPYAPIAEALGSLGALRTRRLAQQLDDVWRDQLAPLIPALTDAESHKTSAQLRPADERDRMHEAIASAFEALSRLGPTLVVLEDVHWADEDTVAVLLHLAGRVADHPILLALSYRHGEARERADVWDLLRSIDRQPHCERVSVTACSPAQTEELIRKSLGVPEVGAEFSERVHRETGGIPLFIIETLRAWYEKEGFEPSSLEAADDRDTLPVAPAVHRLITHRLGGLASSVHATLDLVAVHDGELTVEEIVDAGESNEIATLEAVDELVGRRLLDERGGSYRVGHELMRRVIYDSLTPSRRLELHRRVALAIERHRPELVEVLAHHFVTAGMPDRAADYLEKAAQRAVEVHAYDTAALHLARAARALDDIDAPASRRFAVAALQEEVLDTLARRDRQGDVLVALERYATPEQHGEVLRRRAWWLAHVDRFTEAEQAASRAYDLAREADDGGETVAALTALGMIACWAGRAADGVVHLEAAAGFRGADRRQQADARNALGQNLIDLQRFDDAESQLLAALALYGDLGDARGQADVLGMLATLRMERGEPDAAAADYERAIDISRSIGFRHGEAVYLMNLGILQVIQGHLHRASEAFQAASRVYESVGNRRGLALVLANSAWMRHAMLGDDARAEADTQAALEVYREIGDLRGEAQSLANLGSIAARRARSDEARSLLDSAIELARNANDSWIAAQVLRERAAVELEVGSAREGLRASEEAIRICEQMGMGDLAISVKALRGRLLLETGFYETAIEATREAVEALRPGVELAHLVPFYHSLALASVGDHESSDRFLGLAHSKLMQMLEGFDPETRDTALQNVPSHREIIERWSQRQPLKASFRLAAIAAPGGRPLTASDRIVVDWTIHLPEDAEIPNLVERRQHRLRRLLEEASHQGAAPTVNDLAEALHASPATIRRDLAALRRAGEDVTTRGSRKPQSSG